MSQQTMQTEIGSITINLNSLPEHESDRMCKTLLQSMRKFYENPEAIKEFEVWQAKRNAKEAKHG